MDVIQELHCTCLRTCTCTYLHVLVSTRTCNRHGTAVETALFGLLMGKGQLMVLLLKTSFRSPPVTLL
jgi:hypothetical protein